jgi:hypothetical protein
MNLHNIIDAYEHMAEYGTAPREGCKLFDVGNAQALERLRDVYLLGKMERGSSGEKFVIGPYGSGKTHFLRQVLELSQSLGCVTSEVALTKDVDSSNSFLIYKATAAAFHVPQSAASGISGLFQAAVTRVQQAAEVSGHIAEPILDGWLSALGRHDFRSTHFSAVLPRALEALRDGDAASFEAFVRWFNGDVIKPSQARRYKLPVVPRNELQVFGQQALLSMFQFIRLAGFRGTVVVYDEAEQSFALQGKRLDRLLSLLQSKINALADLTDGAAVILYAITPDVAEKMATFAALQQRIADPGPSMSFFDGNPYAVKIDLTQHRDGIGDLSAIGRKLADLLVGHLPGTDPSAVHSVHNDIQRAAQQIAAVDATSGSRRTMVKQTCALLLSRLGHDIAAAIQSNPSKPSL